MNKKNAEEFTRKRSMSIAEPKQRKSRLTTAIKNLKQIHKPQGKFLFTDGKYIDFGDLMQEEDFVQDRYKKAAQKYQELIQVKDYHDIKLADIGLDPAIDEELDLMTHFRFIYG